MKLYGYTRTYNEEELIPYVMPYVERLGYDKFIVWDNCSTDRTVELLKKYPFVEVRTYDTNGKFDDDRAIKLMFCSIQERLENIKNNEETWMTWTDFDEVIFSNEIELYEKRKNNNFTFFRGLLENAYKQGYNLCAPQMYHLLSKKFPPQNALVHENVERCCLWLLGRKSLIFNLNNFIDVKTTLGFHQSFWKFKNGTKDFSEDIGICAFHLKYLDYEYNLKKDIKMNERSIECYSKDKEEFDIRYNCIWKRSFPLELFFANKSFGKLNISSGIVDENFFKK